MEGHLLPVENDPSKNLFENKQLIVIRTEDISLSILAFGLL